MKTGIQAILWLIAMAFVSCHPRTTPEKPAKAPARRFEKPMNQFAGIQFASQRDTSCGMMLSAGMEDTIRLNGKIYGFCSKECKNDFIKMLQKQHKR